jgi:hypothetical protein
MNSGRASGAYWHTVFTVSGVGTTQPLPASIATGRSPSTFSA